MGGLHWRKKGGGKDAGGSSARKQVVLTAAQLTELESYIQDMEAKCAQFQTVVGQKAAAEAAMRGQLEGLAAGVEGERAARESALDALMTDFESRVSARLPPPSSARSTLPTITSSATAAPTEPDSISQPSTLAPPPHTPTLPPSSFTSSLRSSLPSSLSTSLTTFVSSSSEIEALAQRARAAALAAAAAAAGRGGGGAAAAAPGAADFAALPGVSAGGGDFPGVAEAGGMMAYPGGGPHTSLIPTSSTGANSAVTERNDGGGGGWSLGLGLRWSGGRVQRRQRFVVDTAWLEGIRRDYMELQRQLAEEQQKNLVVQQLAAEKAWMEAALMRFLQMKRQHEEEVAQLLAKVARLEQAVASSNPSVPAATDRPS
ncbi:unnamed protein product [Closterium sp. NIES-64]|nr:unnamed protein product [Closterium sp. NIES-64]